MLTVFQVLVDLESSQMLDTERGLDPQMLEPPRDGESIAARPWPRTLEVWDPDRPRANFFHFSRWFLTMDDRAASVCRSALELHGDFVCFDLEGKPSEKVYMFSPRLTLTHEAVDWAATQRRFGLCRNVTLDGSRIPAPAIFRMPEMGGLYLSTQLEEGEMDFFHLYKKYQLTGLYFKRLWDEHGGPVPGRTTGPDPWW
jgi:hypothetical protein